MSDNTEQTPKAPTPAAVAPSPQSFARPAASVLDRAPGKDTTEQDRIAHDATTQDGAVDGATSRFASTGDPRVDRALAQLPDPAEHQRGTEEPTGGGGPHGSTGAASDGNDEQGELRTGSRRGEHGDDDSEGLTGIGLPDPSLLDAHLAEVTAVHRQLQQRLSDLSG